MARSSFVLRVSDAGVHHVADSSANTALCGAPVCDMPARAFRNDSLVAAWDMIRGRRFGCADCADAAALTLRAHGVRLAALSGGAR